MKKPVPALIPFLVFVSMVFIGILVYAYIETKKANPQMIETTRGGANAPLVLAASLPGQCRLESRPYAEALRG
ncbi:MAG TPA: hypothetical protein VMA31_06515 [Bryobacteraceae bacterium]|nr:hypothetical protein [Bryobacteraceae bacterium]